MSDSTFYNEITITPPLTWQECRATLDCEYTELHIDERVVESATGQTRILTAHAIIAARFAYGPHMPAEIQAIIDAHLKHEFTGYIEEWVTPGYRMLPCRYLVRDRKVVAVRAAWPAEASEGTEV